MCSLHTVEAQFCITHEESKGCFTFLDPFCISTYDSFESLLQIIFCSIPLLSKKKKRKKKRLSSSLFSCPSSSLCASMPKMNHCIITFLLLVSFRWLSLSACFMLTCQSSLTCGAPGSLTPGKTFSSSLVDTREPPAHVTVLEGGQAQHSFASTPSCNVP